MAQDPVHRIGELILDIERGTLQRGGEVVLLRRKTFDLLAYFASNPGRVLTKDELFDAVWPRTTVSEDSLTQCIRDARKCIGDEEQAVIRTVQRRGYLFQPPAVAVASAAPAMASQAHAGPAEPMVAVLPFRLGRIEEAARPLFDGVVEEITNALSYFKTIAVLARHSAFALAQTAPEQIRDSAERFGATFLVEGSVENADDALRVTVTLSEAASGRRLWAQDLAFETRDVFAFQRAVAQRIATALVSSIESAALRQISPAPTRNIEAYGHILRGMALLRSYGEGVNQQAREHLLKALALDPGSGLALAYVALAELIIAGYGSAPPDMLDQVRDKALQALSLSPDEARCHRILALTLLYRRDYAAAEEHFARALDLNPYDADTLAQMGYLQAMRGRAESGLSYIDRAFRLNPLHPAWYYFDRGDTLFCLGHYREAAASFACLPRKDAWHLTRLAASQAMAGDKVEAVACCEAARRLDPDLTVEAILRDVLYELAQDRERLRQGLALAGWNDPTQ